MKPKSILPIRVALCKFLGADPTLVHRVLLELHPQKPPTVRLYSGKLDSPTCVDFELVPLRNAKKPFDALYKVMGVDPQDVCFAKLDVDVNDVPRVTVERVLLQRLPRRKKAVFALVAPERGHPRQSEITTLADVARRYAPYATPGVLSSAA